MRTVRICRQDELEDEGKTVVQIDGLQIGVFRVGEDFYAYKNVCPHQGGPVCQGRIYQKVVENLDPEMKSRGRDFDANGVHIVCPWHGLEFDVRTGRFAGASDVDIMSLEGYATHVQDGDVYVIVE